MVAELISAWPITELHGADPGLVVIDVPLTLIDNGPAICNSRSAIGDVTELAQSITELGLLQPIGVRRSGARFTIVYGHRRVAAVRWLGWTDIAAVLVDATADDDLLRSLAENIQRRQLGGAERAAALERLAATGIGGNELARRLGKSRTVTWAWLKVGRSRALLDALSSNLIGINQARQMVSLTDGTIADLLPELAGKPEAWMQARIARAVADQRQAPAHGTFKKHAETHVLRSLELILEHAKSIREIRSQAELELLRQIIDLVGHWKRDLMRACGRAVASCVTCGEEQVLEGQPGYHPRCERCGARLFTLVATQVIEARAG